MDVTLYTWNVKQRPYEKKYTNYKKEKRYTNLTTGDRNLGLNKILTFSGIKTIRAVSSDGSTDFTSQGKHLFKVCD